MATLKPQSNGPLYSNTAINILAVDGWAVPNVTTHPSTASVPTSYYSMWHYNCLWFLKGLTMAATSTCPCALNHLRPVYSDATQLNSTRRRVELSCVAINGPLQTTSTNIKRTFKKLFTPSSQHVTFCGGTFPKSLEILPSTIIAV